MSRDSMGFFKSLPKKALIKWSGKSLVCNQVSSLSLVCIGIFSPHKIFLRHTRSDENLPEKLWAEGRRREFSWKFYVFRQRAQCWKDPVEERGKCEEIGWNKWLDFEQFNMQSRSSNDNFPPFRCFLHECVFFSRLNFSHFFFWVWFFFSSVLWRHLNFFHTYFNTLVFSRGEVCGYTFLWN